MATNWAELHRQVLFGQSGGRIIWQPRILAWYTDKVFAGETFPEPFTGMDPYEIYRELNCSARLYEYNNCFVRVEHPSVQVTKRRLNETDIETTIRTPVGNQKKIQRETSDSWHLMDLKREVETQDELRIATWREENATWRWDDEVYRSLQAEVGELGAPTMFMPRMNVQNLYLDKMGVQNGIYAIIDWTDLAEAYFAALEACHDRLIDVINTSPVEIINYGENVHAHTLPPKWFVKYHLPACQHRSERLHAAGKFVYSHWDGNTGPLLKYARETGLDGIEAITPVPQGDVTLDEVADALGDELFLLDGIPAVFFDDTYSIEELVECTYRLIDLFAPKLVLGISDEISSTGDLERVRMVGAIVEEYNAQFE